MAEKNQRIVIKIGSSSIVNEDLSVNEEMINHLFSSITELKKHHIDCALVSSGAIALGMYELGFKSRPNLIAVKQACAAVGQSKLMEAYNRIAVKYHIVIGQILVSHDDFEIRKRMNHLSNTLDAMFKNNVIPIINENDALAVEEIKVGDNDTLASLIAPMMNASMVILFSDIDGLYDKNPKIYKDATLIKDIYKIDEQILSFGTKSISNVGTGGMQSKINAARIANMAGIDLLICNAERMKDLCDIVTKGEIGTTFHRLPKAINLREHWIIFKTNAKGCIVIDDGVKQALKKKKISILAKGVIEVKGEFIKDNVINVCDKQGNTIAKGITNYSATDINQLRGLSNDRIKGLGHTHPEIIHANNLVMMEF